MAISAIGGAAAYQAYHGVSAAQTARSAQTRGPRGGGQPAGEPAAVPTPDTRSVTDRVTLSSAVKPPSEAAAEPKLAAPKTGEAARTIELGTDRRQSALDALKDQSRVLAQDNGGQAAGRLHVVA